MAVSSESALARWLADALGTPHDSLALAPLAASGDSNLMVDVVAPGGRWVLRRPPSAKNDRSAHDVLREHRLLRALDRTALPHPRPVAHCDDPAIIGVPFYVMEHVDGFSPSVPLPPAWASSPALADLGPRAAEFLAELAATPWDALGLEGFGRPEGFLDRQVRRWMAQFERYKVRELDGLAEVARWLEEHRPAEQPPAILHGDFHLRNVMFAPEPPARLVAVVDWEMATVGDPLLDLGTLLGTWSEPGEPVFMSGSATQAPGMATRAAIAAAYERHGGRSLEHIDYYMALALFKLACIVEGSYSRLLAGRSEHEGHRTYETLVPLMVRRALAITTGAWGVDRSS